MLAFAYPCRPWPAFYIAAGFDDPNYGTGRRHKGIDVNLRTGGDTDLGYPVQSMFPGQVVFASRPGSWGGVVLVRSEKWVTEYVNGLLGTDWDSLEVQYAHLHQMTVRVGDYVNAGDHVGSIGKGGNNQYLAHLHLEVRSESRPADEPQSATVIPPGYVDPDLILQRVPLSDFGNVHPSRRLVVPASGVSIEGGFYADPKLVVTNSVSGKFYFRTEGIPSLSRSDGD